MDLVEDCAAGDLEVGHGGAAEGEGIEHGSHRALHAAETARGERVVSVGVAGAAEGPLLDGVVGEADGDGGSGMGGVGAERARVVRPVTERGEGGDDAHVARGRGDVGARDDRDEGDAALAPDEHGARGVGVGAGARTADRRDRRVELGRGDDAVHARGAEYRRGERGRVAAAAEGVVPLQARSGSRQERVASGARALGIAIGRRRRSRRERAQSGDIADVRAPREAKRGGGHVGRVRDPSLGPRTRACRAALRVRDTTSRRPTEARAPN